MLVRNITDELSELPVGIYFKVVGDGDTPTYFYKNRSKLWTCFSKSVVYNQNNFDIVSLDSIESLQVNGRAIVINSDSEKIAIQRYLDKGMEDYNERRRTTDDDATSRDTGLEEESPEVREEVEEEE